MFRSKPTMTAAAMAAITLTSPITALAGDWAVGLGVVHEVSAYAGAGNNDADLIPYIAFEGDRISADITGVSYRVYEKGALELDLGIAARWGLDLPDTALFSGLDRKATAEAAIRASYDFGPGDAVATIQRDILSVHDGIEARLELDTEIDTGTTEFGLSAGATYRDQSLNQHLFGVAATEATAARAAYDPKADWTPFIGARFATPITDNLTLVGFAETEHLSPTARNSPLIAKEFASEFGLFVLTEF